MNAMRGERGAAKAEVRHFASRSCRLECLLAPGLLKVRHRSPGCCWLAEVRLGAVGWAISGGLPRRGGWGVSDKRLRVRPCASVVRLCDAAEPRLPTGPPLPLCL